MRIVNKGLVQATQTRSLVTKTSAKFGPQKTFTPPFNKATVFGLVWGLTGLGIFVPVYTVVYQNKKHGFWK